MAIRGDAVCRRESLSPQTVLTADVGTSCMAAGSTGAHVLVEIEKYTGATPPVRAPR